MSEGSQSQASIIFDWNEIQSEPRPTQPFDLNDETLRDGVQSPSVTDPPLEAKLEILELMESIGVRSADIGLPGAGKRAFEDVVALAQHIQRRKLQIEPNCAARTLISDIQPIADAVQKSSQKIVLYTFIGSSPIRQFAESWDLEFILKSSIEAIDFGIKQGLEVAYVTEDTTRASPQNLEPLFRSAIEHGATRLVLCDTVGHATPAGAHTLVDWTKRLIAGTGAQVKIDWHGHNDRAMAVSNALAALEAGAHRVHACGLGIGERVGNTSMDLLLLNLKLMGWIDQDLAQLVAYVRKVSVACKVPIPCNYPLSGSDAFRTATGVHAAAIIKAKARGDAWLADRVYSGVPAGEFGRQQEIEVGHMSGMSNVKYWLESRGIRQSDELCKEILARAKSSTSTLTEAELLSIVDHHARDGSGTPSDAPALS
jgi:2-isopropylmalate synthase